MLDPKVDAAVKGLSPLNWPLTVNDLELWNKENLVVAKMKKRAPCSLYEILSC